MYVYVYCVWTSLYNDNHVLVDVDHQGVTGGGLYDINGYHFKQSHHNYLIGPLSFHLH